ncbi:SGNH/GDSL hydrolase family protein [Dongshaea marina]|uniref:SGNH/GDSL hydrolase family protein n=1 Tax=Dongshaea marina TaxID=2047966 RepID=UPI000D3EB1B8|nr:SGNH/GDSL hydrolase family protein [Dongshaea marina]
MKGIKYLLMMVSLLVGLSFMPVYGQAVSHLLIFGDSLSDSGNNSWITTEGPYVGAAISNPDENGVRKTWANYFADKFSQKLGYGTQGELLPFSRAADDTLNINFAWASAETGDHYLNDMTSSPYFIYDDEICPQPGIIDPEHGIYCVPSVGKQIDLFLQGYPSYLQNSLIVLWGVAMIFSMISLS